MSFLEVGSSLQNFSKDPCWILKISVSSECDKMRAFHFFSQRTMPVFEVESATEQSFYCFQREPYSVEQLKLIEDFFSSYSLRECPSLVFKPISGSSVCSLRYDSPVFGKDDSLSFRKEFSYYAPGCLDFPSLSDKTSDFSQKSILSALFMDSSWKEGSGDFSLKCDSLETCDRFRKVLSYNAVPTKTAGVFLFVKKSDEVKSLLNEKLSDLYEMKYSSGLGHALKRILEPLQVEYSLRKDNQNFRLKISSEKSFSDQTLDIFRKSIPSLIVSSDKKTISFLYSGHFSETSGDSFSSLASSLKMISSHRSSYDTRLR